MVDDLDAPTALDRARQWLTGDAGAPADRAEALDRHDLELDEILDVSRRLALAIAGRPELWGDPALQALSADLTRQRDAAVARWIEIAVPLRLSGVRLRAEPRRAAIAGRPPAGDGRDRGDPAWAVSGRHVVIDDGYRQRIQAALSGQYPAVSREVALFSPQAVQAARAELADLPAAIDSEDQVRAEFRALVRLSRPERQDTWRSFPDDLQVALVAHLAARARRLQEPALAAWLANADADRQLEIVFNALSRYTKDAQPGFVHGLARTHEPKSGSWLKDAQDYLAALDAWVEPRTEPAPANPEREIGRLEALIAEGADDSAIVDQLDAAVTAGVVRTDRRLVRLLRPKLELLGRHARFKALRKAIKDADETDDAPDRQAGPAADWPCWPYVRGKRAAIVGGDPREDARSRIQAAFELASLAWEAIDAVRQVEALATQIRSGNVDLVILIQSLINHSMCGKIVDACRSAKVPFAAVERGYGVERIRLAIEQDVSRRFGDAAGATTAQLRAADADAA